MPLLPSLHISRFGVISKNNQPGKWRLILDLSSPEGQSVNDGIPKPPFRVEYVSVDAFIDGIMTLGRGTLMAKFSVASAYRNVAIHPDDRPLLDMRWCGQYFVDLVLPFGLRSAHLSLQPFQTWLNEFWFTIMMSHSSVITWTISSPWAHQLPCLAQQPSNLCSTV